jgi:hypothetical protein
MSCAESAPERNKRAPATIQISASCTKHPPSPKSAQHFFYIAGLGKNRAEKAKDVETPGTVDKRQTEKTEKTGKTEKAEEQGSRRFSSESGTLFRSVGACPYV